jgi:hypothetical protein
VNGTTASPQPFFENMMVSSGPNAVCSPGTCTAVAAELMPSVGPGDLGFFDYLANAGALGALAFTTPTSNNQIFEFATTTDAGYSNYNAGIITMRKALSEGLQFQFNYTWSHAIGNQGLNQQYDYSSESPYNLNLDKSSELFDHRNTVTAFWYYELPFGKGKTVGGWNISGIYTFFSGSPLCVGAIGNYGSFFDEDCAVAPAGFPSFSRHNNVTGSDGIGTTGNVNAFADPAAVYNSLQYPLLSQTSQIPHDQLHNFPFWNVDFSLQKKISVTERVGVVLSGDAFNLFNHVTLLQPSLDLGNPAGFGVLTQQFATSLSNTGARTMQLGLRIEF